MEIIRNSTGDIVQRSRNLAGIRRYVGTHLIKQMSVDRALTLGGKVDHGCSAGKLCILFDNGCSFECNWASYQCLVDFVRRWRNVHGAPLLMNGVDCGVVSKSNPPEATRLPE